MKIDSYNTLVMEHVSWPGNIGDSCAETSRYLHLLHVLNRQLIKLDLNQFVTNLGFVRHPTAPAKDDNGDSWREDDFSSDQGLPLFLAAKCSNLGLANIIKDRIKENKYRTGNGDLIAPMFYSLMYCNWLTSIFVLFQALLFKLPFRWSDSENKFEEMEESSADYLNWIHTAIYAPKWIRKLISKNILKQKVREYYLPEPNVKFLINLYDEVIDKYW